VIRKIRALIAVTVGLVVLLLTLGRVKIDWSGTASSDGGSDRPEISDRGDPDHG